MEKIKKRVIFRMNFSSKKGKKKWENEKKERSVLFFWMRNPLEILFKWNFHEEIFIKA
jgi:hypothetical protein